MRGEAPDRLEREDGAFFDAIAGAYDALAAAEPERFRVLDAGAEPAARAGRGAGRAGRPGLASVAMLGRRGAIALTCAAALLVPAAAHANAFDDTLKEYTQTGAVDGCKHTADELAQAKAQTPKDIAQTAPGYPAQLAAAAEKRAKGCTKAEEQATNTSTAAAPAATARPPRPAAGSHDDARPGATQAPFGTTTAPAATQPPATATARRRRPPRPLRSRPPRTAAPASPSSSSPRCW